MIDKATYSKFRYEWYRIQKTKVPVMFDNLNEFVQWCKDSGYVDGYRLYRIETDLPWKPGNMEWREFHLSPNTLKTHADLIKQWDDFIIPVREMLANLPPEEPRPVKVTHKPEVFRYEHPDLVREGIVFESSRRV